MKKLLLVFVVLTVSFSVFAEYTSEQKKDFLYFMKRACGGENECYYRVEQKLDENKGGNGIIYFSCHVKFSGMNISHEPFGKCLNIGAKGYEKLLRKNGYRKLANIYKKQIPYCESKGGYHTQFSCLKNFLKNNKGKYAK